MLVCLSGLYKIQNLNALARIIQLQKWFRFFSFDLAIFQLFAPYVWPKWIKSIPYLWAKRLTMPLGRTYLLARSFVDLSRRAIFLSLKFLICFYWQLWPFNARSVLTFRETRDSVRVTVSLASWPAVRTLIGAWQWGCRIHFWAPSRSGIALLASRVTRTVNSTVS